jgi:hypothetical protein
MKAHGGTAKHGVLQEIERQKEEPLPLPARGESHVSPRPFSVRRSTCGLALSGLDDQAIAFEELLTIRQRNLG